MTEKLRFTRAQMRNMAVIAKEEGVKIIIAPDGSLSVLPFIQTETSKMPIETKGIVRL